MSTDTCHRSASSTSRAGARRSGKARLARGSKDAPHERDSALIRSLVAWFARAQRDLPWRAVDPATGRRDPYRVLVSEVMLQQTQVARVLDRFHAFVDRFPDAPTLAAASLPDVLSLWSGLGYYSRARNLHAAAREIVERHSGAVPADAASLRSLPGVGRYTAGAVASFAFNQPEPIVDGNVARVLIRIRGQDVQPGPASLEWAWTQAEPLVRVAAAAGAAPEFNESLMELGATVCLPRNPRCESCPAADACTARRRGIQNDIPRPKPAPARKRLSALVAIIRDAKGRILLERRPDTGLWAGLWQPPTLLRARGTRSVAAQSRDEWSRSTRELGRFEAALSHRNVLFVVKGASRPVSTPAARRLTSPVLASERRWVAPRELTGLGISNAHRKALEIGGCIAPRRSGPAAF